MNYFKDCQTAQEAKTRFKELCMLHHPDRGGNEETFKIVLSQFQAFTPSDQTKESYDKYSESFVDLITKLSFLIDAEITVVGCWVWVEAINGNKINRKTLEEHITEGYEARFNMKRKLWQIKPAGFRHRKRSSVEHDKESLVNFYGGGKQETYQRTAIATV